MVVRMYSMYDLKAKYYHKPVYCQNDEHAKRIFTQALEDPKTTFGQFPEDFRIFYIGDFDDSSSLMVSQNPPILVCDLTELERKDNGIS